MAATQKPREQRLAFAKGPAGPTPFAVGIIHDLTLVPFEVVPRDVSLVMIDDQYLPVFLSLLDAVNDPLPPAFQRHSTPGSAECIGAGINRVRQDVVDLVVDGRRPNHGSTVGAILREGQFYLFLSEPEMDLPNTLELGELGKDQMYCLANPQIGIHLDPVMANSEVTDGYCRK